ncbi:transcriptional regulator [Veronia nyctiphanis]|uniref:Transcriptional regulator n=1 Tax=Veronia nyctiphanis TaxID=1278244 RepID=A0A4Q0YT67_9GAMM|nr:PLP-dependent aminotransferase family protein [Veronia nyctiphanis]RXJ74452.1 transcriptional regulator [Veronia nyctiphanis]
MSFIDIGDLYLDKNEPRQAGLYNAIRDKILMAQWTAESRLPATRVLAEQLSISRNTVTATYDQLKAEGYIDSVRGSGYFVSLLPPERFLSVEDISVKTVEKEDQTPRKTFRSAESQALTRNRPFQPGVPDLDGFPYKKWTRFLQRQSGRALFSGQNDPQGAEALRRSISHYLVSSRSVDCCPERVIVTQGAQQAIYIALSVLMKSGEPIVVENPGYKQMLNTAEHLDLQCLPVNIINGKGVDTTSLSGLKAKCLYLTPSNHYPMGCGIGTGDRIACIEWAQKHNAWIIEDDYDTEFQFGNKPFPSLQGLATRMSGGQPNIVYIGTFSKTMLPSLRIGYMVVPDTLVEKCLAVKEIIGGNTAVHSELALSEFIDSGDYLRHIRKMRRSYQTKCYLFISLLRTELKGQVEILSQEAGMHVTFGWTQGPSAVRIAAMLEKEKISIRTLEGYKYKNVSIDNTYPPADNILIAGFGNASEVQIREGVKILAECFNRKPDISDK